ARSTSWRTSAKSPAGYTARCTAMGTPVHKALPAHMPSREGDHRGDEPVFRAVAHFARAVGAPAVRRYGMGRTESSPVNEVPPVVRPFRMSFVVAPVRSPLAIRASLLKCSTR